MDNKFSNKQLILLLGINVIAGVIAGLVVYQLTKPKTDTQTPAPAKVNTTPQATTSTLGEA